MGRRWRNLICAKKLLPRFQLAVPSTLLPRPSLTPLPLLVLLPAPFDWLPFFNAIKRKLIRHRQAKPRAGKELCTLWRGRERERSGSGRWRMPHKSVAKLLQIKWLIWKFYAQVFHAAHSNRMKERERKEIYEGERSKERGRGREREIEVCR